MKRFLISAAFALFAPAAFAQLPPAPVGDPAHPETIIEFGAPQTVIVDTEAGEVVFEALIADSDTERQRGLMFRESLADNEGMLFDYQEVQTVSMWMRNTLIPLDLIYIAPDGEILKIIANARPHSLRSLPSDFPVLGVLEVRGGLTRDAGIQPGDTVRHAMFGNTEVAVSEDDSDAEEDANPDGDVDADAAAAPEEE
ncbi:DUF192 domain-containing protein [Hyphobacterium sp.]|uniref:DUF192 domain-containing protein n=1 Tax=Hyphobacterium sp. TaxID=2004662 RepID=UPI0037496F75